MGVDRAAVEPDADAEADPVEAPDVDAEAVRVDVAGADVAGLEQPLSRSEEVQDHRVDDLPRRGDLVDLAVDEPLLLDPVLGEAAVNGGLADEPPASRLGALGELLALEPVLLVEQPLASLRPHIEERDARVVLEDVLAALLGSHGTDVGHDLLGDDLGLLALAVGHLTEEALDLGDTVEVDTHDLTSGLLARGLAGLELELLEQGADRTVNPTMASNRRRQRGAETGAGEEEAGGLEPTGEGVFGQACHWRTSFCDAVGLPSPPTIGSAWRTSLSNTAFQG